MTALSLSTAIIKGSVIPSEIIVARPLQGLTEKEGLPGRTPWRLVTDDQGGGKVKDAVFVASARGLSFTPQGRGSSTVADGTARKIESTCPSAAGSDSHEGSRFVVASVRVPDGIASSLSLLVLYTY